METSLRNYDDWLCQVPTNDEDCDDCALERDGACLDDRQPSNHLCSFHKQQAKADAQEMMEHWDDLPEYGG